MSFRLIISEDAYTLQWEQGGSWSDLAVLEGGGRALLPAPGAVGEASLEAAIEIAEDWLMPHAARLESGSLEVEDATGRLRSGLEDILSIASRAWRLEDVERMFLQLVGLTTGRMPPPSLRGRELFIADVLLLRELAHHGRLGEVRLP